MSYRAYYLPFPGIHVVMHGDTIISRHPNAAKARSAAFNLNLGA